jgi:cell wall-associated NlpC family hydrolase
MKDRNLRNFEKFTFIALVIFAVAYVTYHKFKVSPPKENPIDQRTSSIPANDALKDSIVDYGMEFLGTPYVVGGCSKEGFDCSGFTYFVFQHFNIAIPRSSAEFASFGQEIPIGNVRKGDLLLFLSPTRNVIGHIGIVSTAKGRESDFIHASSGHEMKVIISSLAGDGYTQRFVKAVRVF